MHQVPTRPIVIDAVHDPCGRCGARQRSVCGVIDEADLGRLAAAAVVRRFEKGEVFIHEGDPATDFFNITAGVVKLFKLLPDGRQQVTGFVGTGHFLGLAVHDTYAFSAEAIEPACVCRFSRRDMRTLLDDFPALEHRLLETACHELAAAQEQMLLLGRKTARERVASFLLGWKRRSTGCCAASTLHLPMTRADIADYLGLTIETVSRTFSAFRREKLLELRSAQLVELRDCAALEMLAGLISPHA